MLSDGSEAMMPASLQAAVKPEPSGSDSAIDWSARESEIEELEEIQQPPPPPPHAEHGDDPMWPGTNAALRKSVEDVVIVLD